MDDSEENIKALKAFANSEDKQLTEQLQAIISNVAKTGKYRIPWELLKPLYLHALDTVLNEFIESLPPKTSDGVNTNKVEELNKLSVTLKESFSKFTSAPFTIQRISELIIQPRRHYKNTIKYFRGLEKNIMVITTVDPEPPDERPAKRSRMEGTDESSSERTNHASETLDTPPIIENEIGSPTFVNTLPSHGEATTAEETIDGEDTPDKCLPTEDEKADDHDHNHVVDKDVEQLQGSESVEPVDESKISDPGSVTDEPMEDS